MCYQQANEESTSNFVSILKSSWRFFGRFRLWSFSFPSSIYVTFPSLILVFGHASKYSFEIGMMYNDEWMSEWVSEWVVWSCWGVIDGTSMMEKEMVYLICYVIRRSCIDIDIDPGGDDIIGV